MKKEIIFFCPSIEEGGVEKNLYLTSSRISQKFRTSLITANRNKKKMFNKKINFISTTILNFNNSTRIIKSICCLFLLLKYNLKIKNKVIIISYESNIFAIIVAKILKFPIVVRSNASPTGYLNSKFKKYFFKFFFQLADVVLVNSTEFKSKIDRILNIKSKLIYNSILNKSLLKKLSNKKISNLNISKKTYKLIMIGRLVDQKDHLTTLKALNLLKKKINFFLLIIGKGDLKNKLQEYCKNNEINNQVKFLGFKNNIYPYLKWCDALILSSIYEGSPNVIIEAISMNRTVISSNCPTGPKEILNNGKSGFLFKTSDYKDLANQIYKSYFNKIDSKTRRKNALKNVKKYSINKNTNDLIKIINSLK